MTTISFSIPDSKLEQITAYLKKEGAKILLPKKVEKTKALTPTQKKVKALFEKYEAEKGKPLTLTEKEDIAFGVMMEESRGKELLTEDETKSFFEKLAKKK